MRSFFAFLLAMGIIVALSDAYCFTKRNTAGQSGKGCILNGKLYPFGEIERTEDCLSCSCNREEIRCCSLYHTPVNYDKERCKVVFNKKTCNYDVVEKDDPSKECFVYSRVG